MEVIDNLIDFKLFNKTKPNWIFFIFFAGLYLFYTNTYIQIALYLIIALYVFIDFFRNKTFLSFNSWKTIIMYCLWLGLLTLIAALSRFWAYAKLPESRTLLNLVKSFVVGILMLVFVKNQTRFLSVLKSLLYASVVLCVAVLLTTPISGYGDDKVFGVLIGQQRNGVGLVCAFFGSMCIYLYLTYKIKFGKLLIAIFLITLLCTGSRGALFQVFISFILMILTQKQLNKKIKGLVMVTLSLVLFFSISMFIPFFQEMIIQRFASLFDTINGSTNFDGSTKGRMLYVYLGLEMFCNKPFLGYGIDGFATYFADHPVINGIRFTSFPYSHNNIAELAADFGIVGLFTWYWLIIYILIKSIKNYKKNFTLRLIVILLGADLILDIAHIPWSSGTHMILLNTILLMFRLSYKSKKTPKKIVQQS